MKKLILGALFSGALTMFSSTVQAHDDCYRDYREYRGEHYGYRESVRYERPYYRPYYSEDRPVIIRREIIVDGCRDVPRYSYRHHHRGIRVFFGF